MYYGDVGGVSGGGDVQWNRKLAEELDAADGKKDGKISANIWNGYLGKVGSNGNKIKNFINVDNAARSFNYYDKKKDVGKVDWGNWQAMLDKFTGKETPDAGGETEVTTHPPVSPVTTGDEPKVTQQQQADFEKAMQDAKFADKFPSAEELKADGWQQAYIEKRPYGNVTYTNADGSTITESDSRADNPINPGKDYTRTLKYTDKNGTTNTITYDKDGKPIQGTLTMKQADGTSVEYKYTYDSEGKKVLQGCKMINAETSNNNLSAIGEKLFDISGSHGNLSDEELAYCSNLDFHLTNEQQNEAESLYNDIYTNAPIETFDDGSLGHYYQKGIITFVDLEDVDKLEPLARAKTNFLIAGKQEFLEFANGKSSEEVHSAIIDYGRQVDNNANSEKYIFLLTYYEMLESANLEITSDGNFKPKNT